MGHSGAEGLTILLLTDIDLIQKLNRMYDHSMGKILLSQHI